MTLIGMVAPRTLIWTQTVGLSSFLSRVCVCAGARARARLCVCTRVRLRVCARVWIAPLLRVLSDVILMDMLVPFRRWNSRCDGRRRRC